MGLTAAERRKKHAELHTKVVVWFENEDHAAAVAAAQLCGLPLSDYVRNLVLGRPLPDQNEIALRDATAQLMKLGGLMKHLNMQLRTSTEAEKLKVAMQQHDSVYNHILEAIGRLQK